MPEFRIDFSSEDKMVGYVFNSFMNQFERSLRHELLHSKRRVKATYSIFINGRSTAALSDLNTRLKKDDIITILPVVEEG